MPIPNPAAERERLFKAGREWFVQMMLACLVLEERPTKMNMAHSPSERGIKLLGRLDEIAFGAARAGVPEFYWEYRLAAREGVDSSNAWPDLAALWPGRSLLLELKTEAGSIREGQVDWYIELARHHRAGDDIDFLYLTRDPVDSPPQLPERCRYANVTWSQVVDPIRDVWAPTADEVRVPALGFAGYLEEQLATTAPLAPPVMPEEVAARERAVPGSGTPDLDDAISLVDEVVCSGQQAAIGLPGSSVEEAKAFKRALLAQLEQAAPEHPDQVPVQVWVWQSKTGGRALTASGESTGIELRISPRHS